MDVTLDHLSRAARWDALKRWERRELAQDLRRAGLSYAEIAAVIPAGKSSLSAWCRDVELTEEQRTRLRALRPRLSVRIELGARRRASALAKRERVRDKARRDVPDLATEALWIAGLVAYWSEGSKKAT